MSIESFLVMILVNSIEIARVNSVKSDNQQANSLEHVQSMNTQTALLLHLISQLTAMTPHK